MPLLYGASYAGYGECSISASDLATNVDNQASRIAQLEQRIAVLEAANTSTSLLSNIANQLGWITNVTYNGIGGFIQTPNGTLIPPPGVSLSDLGWTMSDGSSWQMVSINPDGSLNFGFGLDGSVGGAQADIWNGYATQITTLDSQVAALIASSTLDYSYYNYNLLNGTITSHRGINSISASITDNSGSGGTAEFTVTLSSSGLYHIDAHGNAVATGASNVSVAMSVARNGTYNYTGSNSTNTAGGNVVATGNASGLLYCTAGDVIYALGNMPAGQTANWQSAGLAVVKLSG